MSKQASSVAAPRWTTRAWEWIVHCAAKEADVAREGRILAGILFILIVLAVLAGTLFIVQGASPSESAIDFICAALLFVVLLDNRRGHVRRSAIATVFFMLVTMNGFFMVVATDVTSRVANGFLWVFPTLIAASILTWEFVCVVSLLCLANVAVLHHLYFDNLPVLGGVPWTQRTSTSVIVLFAVGTLCAISRYQTDRYQRELRARNDDLDHANEALESEVRRRTQDLVIARDTALAASRVKGEILVNMSHELRTPMNAILGNTEFLLDSSLEGNQREYARDVRTSGRALLGLIDDMLEYSNLDMGSVKLDEQPVEVRTWLASAVAPFVATAREKGLSVTVDVHPDVPAVVLSDNPRLRRVLTNLVGNAVKFTQSGSVRIGLDVRAREGQLVRLRWVVQDTGIGIPSERVEGIFETFGQVDASLKRRTTGAGLGLALCKRLVERMGGELTVTSQVGKGSTFTFEVPVKVSVEQQDVRASEPAARSNTVPSPAPLQSSAVPCACSILLAEDNVINQRVALAMLKKLGYEADLAVNGLQAVQAVEKKQYDVILMDVQMPEMDGLEATRTILARTEPSRCPAIIGFTAHVLASDKEQCYAAGMIDIIHKPAELQMLQKVISRALARAA